jgi:hypothetical protein
MSFDAAQIEQQIAAYFAEDVSCLARNGSIGCLTPVAYPDGDHVVVWVSECDDGYVVEERGTNAIEAPKAGRDRSAFLVFAAETAAVHGCRYDGGRLIAESPVEALSEYVWHVATAAAQIAQAGRATTSIRKRASTKEHEFVELVEGELVKRAVRLERERAIEGSSGHTHRATIYLPASETVLEPVGGHWNQASSAFVKLADISQVNGFRLFSMLDDRVGGADEDAANLLSQVSKVVPWSRRDQWLNEWES